MDEKKCKKCSYFEYCLEDYCKMEKESTLNIYPNNNNSKYVYKNLYMGNWMVENIKIV